MLITIFTACSDNIEPEEIEIIDFSGTYISAFTCQGALEQSNDESFEINIEQSGVENQYSIDLGDDVIFLGIQNDNVLLIEKQTINADQDFDVVTMEGNLTKLSENTFNFEFTHSVDDEGSSVCSQSMTLSE